MQISHITTYSTVFPCAGEVEDLAAHLQSTRQQLEENERIKLSLAEDKAHFERVRGSTDKGLRERGGDILCAVWTADLVSDEWL